MKIDEALELGGARPQATSSGAKAALFAVGEREAPASEAPAPVASSPGAEGLRDGAAKVIASQVGLGLAGLASLPVLTRQLGAAAYGEFSLFVTLVGLVTYLDVARQLLIREEASAEVGVRERVGVARVSMLWITALASVVGLVALPIGAAAALTVAAALHGSASRDFASLSASGRVGYANGARNWAWAGAFLTCAALCLLGSPTWALAWPFVGANLALALLYRRALPKQEPCVGAIAALRHSPAAARLRRAGLDLLGFSLAAGAITVLDRVLLDELIGGEAFGVYCGAADVAMRLHIVGSALAAALFPHLARELRERGYEHAARRFVSVASVTACLYFAGLALGIAIAPAVLPLLLGESFSASTPIFIALLVVLYLHSFGFLATPWQRAQGDFCSQRRAYTLAMVLMVAVGLFAIPRWGAWGAVVAFAAARTAELQLVAVEALRMPREVLPRWKLAAATLMFASLAALGAWRVWEA